MKKIVIAIDGYSSCGKSTMAKELAHRLGYVYVDTGAMYRSVTLFALREHLFDAEDTLDADRLSALLPQVRIDFRLNPETLAFVDVQQLSREHLIKDNNGALWIRKARQKTNQMCNVPVLSIPQRILRKYEDNAECIKKGVLLPVISNQRMNAYLKEIADLCGITKRLTTHVARHTAATVVFLANDVSMENVSKILGHSNIRMTQHYAKVLDSSIMRDMANVERNFLIK